MNLAGITVKYDSSAPCVKPYKMMVEVSHKVLF